jgi:predicted DNA-binding transcriptional regulator AlpA
MGATRQTRAAVALPPTLHAEQRLSIVQVEALVGSKKTRIYAEIKAGEFPEPERDGPRYSRWRAGDVLEYLENRRRMRLDGEKARSTKVSAAGHKRETQAVPEPATN